MGYDATGTVRTYILISIVITFFSIVFWIAVGLLWIASLPSWWPPGTALLVFFPAGLAFLAAVMIYLTTYDRVNIGDYIGARGPCLVWGIIDLFAGLIIGGVFLLLAHSKLSDMTSGRPYSGPTQTWQSSPTQATSQASYAARGPSPQVATGRQKICYGCGATIPSGSTSCSRCGRPAP